MFLQPAQQFIADKFSEIISTHFCRPGEMQSTRFYFIQKFFYPLLIYKKILIPEPYFPCSEFHGMLYLICHSLRAPRSPPVVFFNRDVNTKGAFVRASPAGQHADIIVLKLVNNFSAQ